LDPGLNLESLPQRWIWTYLATEILHGIKLPLALYVAAGREEVAKLALEHLKGDITPV
jgi:hypothetical protein